MVEHMKHARRLFLLLLSVWSLFLAADSAAPGQAVLLEISGAIGPATSDYIHRGLDKARARNAAIVILRIDTPGGLDIAMRKINQDILGSPLPVAGYVAPSGARAASAGTYILYASHVAAMAPGTSLGAATPVQIGGVPDPGKSEPVKKDAKDKGDKEPKGDTMTRKVTNDAVAYIRSLAQLRGRNVAWAERAVREAVSLPAEEAVQLKVVDLMARDVDDLLARIDGRQVEVDGRAQILKTKGLAVSLIAPDWRSRLLAVITDPNIAYILMLLGIYGLFFELWNPGFVLPGVVGGICLLLALFAFQVLPVSYAGLALILLGIAFMITEAFVPSFGALGIGGVIAFVAGSILLLDTEVPGFGISYWLIGSVALVSAAFFLTVVSLALKARRRRIVSGSEELIGASGVALEGFKHEGRVRIHSEDWNARTRAPLTAGQKVRVTGREGLTLLVEPQPKED
jgi:membrane-bound serine protease (ClpP class)